MNFKDVFKAMKAGSKVKLPSWGGYWYWDNEKQTIVMHTKDGEELDIRETERVEYTLGNILSDEWVIADESNTSILGGVATFSFGEAIKYLKRGLKVKRLGPDEHSKMTLPYIYIVTDNLITDNPHALKGVVPWLASQTDMLAEDWIFAE